MFNVKRMASGIESRMKSSADPNTYLHVHYEDMCENFTAYDAHMRAADALHKRGDHAGAARARSTADHHLEQMRRTIQVVGRNSAVATSFEKKRASKKRVDDSISEHETK